MGNSTISIWSLSIANCNKWPEDKIGTSGTLLRGPFPKCLPWKRAVELFKFWNSCCSIPVSQNMTATSVQYIDIQYPIGSMYAIYGNIYHQYTPNVSIYTIHGSYGYCLPVTLSCSKHHLLALKFKLICHSTRWLIEIADIRCTEACVLCSQTWFKNGRPQNSHDLTCFRIS